MPSFILYTTLIPLFIEQVSTAGYPISAAVRYPLLNNDAKHTQNHENNSYLQKISVVVTSS